jgi:phosphoribosylformylglycinamidine synthase
VVQVRAPRQAGAGHLAAWRHSRLAHPIGIATVATTASCSSDFQEPLAGDRAAQSCSSLGRRPAGMQSLRDNPRCALEEFAACSDEPDPGLSAHLTFDPRGRSRRCPMSPSGPPASRSCASRGSTARSRWRPRSTAPASSAIDVHMRTCSSGAPRWPTSRGWPPAAASPTATCWARAEGWANSVLFNDRSRSQFAAFFARSDTFSLGVCNGCQMMSSWRAACPGADLAALRAQPLEQFEARLVTGARGALRPRSSSATWPGSRLPIVVSHGEGRAQFVPTACRGSGWWRCVRGQPRRGHAAVSQHNPNGSPEAIVAPWLTNTDGRM